MANQDLSHETWTFIDSNIGADVRKLALAKAPAGVDLKSALVQIAGRQIAQAKLPSWSQIPRLQYPVHLSMEQCTSQVMAQYKSALVREWLGGMPSFRFADLTGGFGVDCFYLSTSSGECHYNEMNPELCRIAEHNYALLGRPQIQIHNQESADFLKTMSAGSLDLIYLDPARRDSSGRKLVSIADCSPDVGSLQSLLLAVSSKVLVKLSPMLDIRKVLNELSAVSRVMAISVEGECKELLVFMERGFSGYPLIQAVNLDRSGKPGRLLSATYQDDMSSAVLLDSNGDRLIPGNYLYEPYASVMKSALFRTLSSEYSAWQVGEASHLFVSDSRIEAFPGREFIIDRVVAFDKHSAKDFFGEIGKANIAVRNFPLTADELRSRFKVADGGNHYVFATTIGSSQHKVLIDSHKS